MSSLSFISSRIVATSVIAILTLFGCGGGKNLPEPSVVYYIHPDDRDNSSEVKMADYMRKHMQDRSKARILTNNPAGGDMEVILHIGESLGGDYGVSYGKGVCHLSAKSERVMTWLIYQFIKQQGNEHPDMVTDDLPPCIIADRDTVVTFPFEYRDIYMPCNQNMDITLLLGLNNLEVDWGLWGHQLPRVLGSNGDNNYGYQNMSPDLFARSGGLSLPEQFCFCSEKLYRLTEQYIIEQYGDGSEYPNRFTISPNDNAIVCQCRQCEFLGNTKDNATPAVTRFVERLAQRFPKHTFFIPAYLTTKTVPDHKLPPNVGVFLSAIDYPRAVGSVDSPEAQAFFRNLEAWKKVTDTVYIWDYICNFDDYLTPYPILYVMQERFREYRKHGVKGLFLNGSGYFYSTTQEAYTFFLSELMLNPDLDIPTLVRTYFVDALPHIGEYITDMYMQMENLFRERGKELPLYGGIDDALEAHLDEPGYRQFYSHLVKMGGKPMSFREKVIYDKTRQIISFSIMELARYHGLDEELGYLTRSGNEWKVKPELLTAIEDLGKVTDEDGLYVLTANEHASMDHMDRINEAGVYIADYENECSTWLKTQPWNDDYLLGMPLTVHTIDGISTTTRLTDGVTGISQSYHWGWSVFPQEDLVIDLPADGIREASELIIGFLNFERHNMAPPKEVTLWADGKLVKTLRRESATDAYEEGERVVYHSHVQLPDAASYELRFAPSQTRVKDVAIDEILAK